MIAIICNLNDQTDITVVLSNGCISNVAAIYITALNITVISHAF